MGSSADGVPREPAMPGSAAAAALPLKRPFSPSPPQMPGAAAWELLTELHTFGQVESGLQPGPVRPWP